MDYHQRALSQTLARATRTFPAVLVTGSRQAGKTSLLLHDFGETHRFVSFERPDVRARALADPVSFLAEHSPPAILDEIQYVPELLHYIKELIDGDRRPGRWLLSGSQSLPLMRGVSQTLAGRVAVVRLDPLSVAEARRAPLPASVDEVLAQVFNDPPAAVAAVDVGDWLLRGGYPEIATRPEVDRRLWFASYIQTYLERDVRDLVQVDDLRTFSRFLSLAAARTAGILNLADFARDVGVAPPTIRRWVSALEASGIVHLLPPYHRNLGKRIIKSPKLYFVDAALAAFLMGWHERDALVRGPAFGALVETAVVGEWLDLFRSQGEPPPLYFYRSPGLEIDLLIERNAKLYAIEVKATATPTPAHAGSLARWLDLVGEPMHAAVACRVDRIITLRPGIRAVPWHLARA